jgi:integrase/recombinase XerD
MAGIPMLGLYKFRRAFAVNSLRNGMDIVTLQRLMGHTSLAIITKYLKLVTQDLQESHRKFGVVDNL